jgi:hypothetical protein
MSNLFLKQFQRQTTGIDRPRAMSIELLYLFFLRQQVKIVGAIFKAGIVRREAVVSSTAPGIINLK